MWRCLYDSNSSVIVTAGFDSAIKVHWLPASLPQNSEGLIELKPFMNEIEIFTTQIPNSCQHTGLTDRYSDFLLLIHLFFLKKMLCFYCGFILIFITMP